MDRTPLKILGPEQVLFVGSYTIGSSGAVATSVGWGATCARSSQGVYTLTFDTKFPYVQAVDVKWRGIAGAALTSESASRNIGWSYSATTGVLTISFLDADDGLATNTELASGEKFDVWVVAATRYALGQS